MTPTTEAGKSLAFRLATHADRDYHQYGVAIAAIETEAAQQALDGAALSLGLMIDPTKMSHNYIEAAFARVEHHARTAALTALRERVAGLAYADDQLSPGDEGWGWNEACAAVLAEIDRALEP
jgi:hypothetical protein